MIISGLFAAFGLLYAAGVSCTKKVLIVSDSDKSAKAVKIIREINQQFKIEEVQTTPTSIISPDDEPLYHSIYYLKPAWGASWTATQVADFVQNGGNFLTTAADNKLLNEFGMEAIEGTFIGSKAQWNSQHSFSELTTASVVTLPSGDIAFKLKNDPKSSDFNPLIQSALHFSSGSAICPKIGGSCQSNTQSISLLATLESRKGNRFAAISSLKLFNELPEEAVKGISGWIQGSKFALKIASISHELSDTRASAPNRGKTELESTIYRVKDRINVRMCLIDASTNERFIPEDVSEVQFELKMMNIQLRKSFDFVDSDGCLNSKNIQLPGKSAIYTLQVNYNRPGWSQLSHGERLLVRPYRHDEFPRFLGVAIPYYVSWLGLLTATYFVLLPHLFKQLK